MRCWPDQFSPPMCHGAERYRRSERYEAASCIKEINHCVDGVTLRTLVSRDRLGWLTFDHPCAIGEEIFLSHARPEWRPRHTADWNGSLSITNRPRTHRYPLLTCLVLMAVTAESRCPSLEVLAVQRCRRAVYVSVSPTLATGARHSRYQGKQN